MGASGSGGKTRYNFRVNVPTPLPREYRPQTISRRGEWIAWALGLVALGVWGILTVRFGRAPTLTAILTIFLLLSGGAISLGNWMDRRTVLRLHPGGVHFYNGLRTVDLAWEEIERVQVHPSNWGDKVHVVGQEGHFSFRTHGEVRARGEVQGRMGFEAGEEILQTIVARSGLQEMDRSGEAIVYLRA